MQTQYEALLAVSEEQRVWQDKNFGTGDHFGWLLIGVDEEVGELSHTLLKKQQKIRNVGDAVDDIKDAVADAVIYLMGACNRLDMSFSEVLDCEASTRLLPKGNKVLAAISGAVSASGKLTNATFHALNYENPIPSPQVVVSRHGATLLAYLSIISDLHGFDIVDAVCDTWSEVVQKRDWVENPENGEIGADNSGDVTPPLSKTHDDLSEKNADNSDDLPDLAEEVPAIPDGV